MKGFVENSHEDVRVIEDRMFVGKNDREFKGEGPSLGPPFTAEPDGLAWRKICFASSLLFVHIWSSDRNNGSWTAMSM